MLKISVLPDGAGAKLLLEGRLVGPWVEELDRCWRELAGAPEEHLLLDLTGVTFVDAPGKALLARMRRGGVEFRATGCLMRCIVEEIAKEAG
jgi:anti-anti-sigma regulatory factor